MKVENRHHLATPWPAAAVYVGRGHALGNPYRIGPDGDRETVIAKYRHWLAGRIEARDAVVLAALRTLRDETLLVCSCAPKPCHAEVIRDLWRAHHIEFAARPAVFVFGSNLAGRHGAGAARYAAALFGARSGVGEGACGESYAIPTKDERLATRTVPEILPAVRRFLRYAVERPDTDFLATPIGTGLAGYRAKWIAPLFAAPPENVLFTDPQFDALVPRLRAAHRVIVAGSRSVANRALVFGALDRLAYKWGGEDRFDVVCGEAGGADTLGREWARSHGHPVRSLPAEWGALDVPGAVVRERNGRRYNARAGHDRNAWMAAYGTHLVAFWDGRSPGTRSMIDMARACGLPVWCPQSRYGAAPDDEDVPGSKSGPESRAGLRSVHS